MIEAAKDVIKFIFRVYIALTSFGPAFAGATMGVITRIATSLYRFM
jgi:hypothetical protein